MEKNSDQVPGRVETEVLNDVVDQGKIFSCSDEMLLHLFSFLPTADVFNVGRTCQRLQRVCKDRTLWMKADLRSKQMTHLELQLLKSYICSDTSTLYIKGYWNDEEHKKDWTFPPSMLTFIKNTCPNLEELGIENFYIVPEKMTMKMYPVTLRKLSLQGTHMKYTRPPFSYFREADTYLANLEVLNLNHCKWFRAYGLLSVSKILHLRELYLLSVASFMNSVPYISLACRFGFKNLEVLDLRNVKLGNSEFASITFIQNLQRILLECPVESPEPEGEDDDTMVTIPSTDELYIKYVSRFIYGEDSDEDSSSDEEEENPEQKFKPASGESDDEMEYDDEDGNRKIKVYEGYKLVPTKSDGGHQIKFIKISENEEDEPSTSAEHDNKPSTSAEHDNKPSTSAEHEPRDDCKPSCSWATDSEQETASGIRKRSIEKSEGKSEPESKRRCSRTDEEKQAENDKGRTNDSTQSRKTIELIFVDCSNQVSPSASTRTVTIKKKDLMKKRPVKHSPQDYITDAGLLALFLNSRNSFEGIQEYDQLADKIGTKITSLTVRNYPLVTDQGLNFIRKVSCLKHVDLTGCGLTQRGIDKLGMDRPDLEIVSQFSSS